MIRWHLNYRLVKRILAVGLLATVVILTAWACNPTTITLTPETITITPPPETIMITLTPETVTITPPPETITITLTPETATITPMPPPFYAGLENPFSWDDASAQVAGKEVFDHSCKGCHAAPSKAVPAPGVDFYAVDYRQSLEESPDFYFWRVSEASFCGAMPPGKTLFSEEERWQVLTYIWSLGGTTPTPTPTPTESIGISMTVIVNGLGEGEEATLRLSPELAREMVLFEQPIIGDGTSSLTVHISPNLEDGFYLLLLEAPEKYFRDPKGYFFNVVGSEIGNPRGLPLVFNFNLGPPSGRAEAIIGFSAPERPPPPTPPTPTPTQAFNEVILLSEVFIPMTLTVTHGTIITWINMDAEEHSVTSDTEGLFDVYLLEGDTFSYLFDVQGTYTYYCVFHPGMIGIIIAE